MKCPRCGTDNVQGRATCYLCHTPLQSASLSTSESMGAGYSGAQSQAPSANAYSASSVSQQGSGSYASTGDGAQMAASSHAENYELPHSGASMDSGFGAGVGQVMSYPPREREVGYPNSGASWMAPPQSFRDQPEATEQIPIPAMDQGASQNTAPYETPDFASKLHQEHQHNQWQQNASHSSQIDDHTLGASSLAQAQAPSAAAHAPSFSSHAPDDATEEMQAGLISPDIFDDMPTERQIRDKTKTAPSQPSIDAAAAPSQAHPRTTGRKPLPKPRLDKDFVFAPKVALPSLFRRLTAGLIDMLIVCTIAALVTFAFGPKMTHPFPHGLHGIDLLATVLQRYTPQFNFLVIAFATTLFLYSSVMLSLGGQTVGKMLLKLKVIDRSGKPFSIIGALARSLALLISIFAGLVGLSWILFDKEYRGLHDRMSGAMVIQNPPTS